MDARASGLVINTCGWVDGQGYELLLHCIKEFAVDVILVMGDDRLYFTLTSSITDSITVVKLPRSGGVVERDSTVRRRARKNTIAEYFYGRTVAAGLPKRLSPSRSDIRLSSVRLLRAGGVQLSEAMLPIGQSAASDPLKLVSIQPSMDLLHSILAVLHSNNEDDLSHPYSVGGTIASNAAPADIPQDIGQSNVAGFLYVVELDIDNDTMVVLSPCPGALPSKYLLMGSIKWVE